MSIPRTHFSRYKENLSVDDEWIYSYNTKVGRFYHEIKCILVEKHWSKTTSKHINYVAEEYGYEVKKEYE